MLSNVEIQKQIDAGTIVIHNLSRNAFKKPNSVDMCLGNSLYTYDYAVLDASMGQTYCDEVIYDKPFNLKKITIPETGLLLQPYKVYLARTVEEVETHGYVPVMHGKVSFSLLGLSIEHNSGYKYDGFSGPMLLSIVATKPTVIYPDLKIANLCFFESLGPSDKTRIINGYECGAYSSGMLSGMEIQRRMEGENPDIIIDDQSKIVINPNSVNLTLNDEIGVYSDTVLDVKKKNAIKKMHIGDGMFLYPNEVYLARTNEWTETRNLVPMISGRSSLGRNGLYVHCSAGMGAIGYRGYWHLGIRPTKPIWVVRDLKCCQIYYYTVEGEIRGEYQGYMQDLPKEEIGSQMYRMLKKK